VSSVVLVALLVVVSVIVVLTPALRERLVVALGAGRGAEIDRGAQSRPVREVGPGRRPLAADDLVDSAGINVHLHYQDTSYARFDDVVRPRLQELGIRHLRDAAYTTPGAEPESFFFDRVRALVSDGRDFQFTVYADPDGTTDFTRLGGIVEASDDGVLAFEGLNEPDLADNPAWPEVTRAVQEDLEGAVSSLGPGAPQVVLPSVVTLEAAAALGDVAGFGDVANLHSYYAGRQPETAGFDASGYGSLPWYRRSISDVTGPGLPVVSTETGYYTAPAGEFWVPSEAKATYLPRLLVYHFVNGVDRTYLYELLDPFDDPDDPQDDFGLVEYDGTPKPAFYAVRDLLALLADPGPEFVPTRLRLDVRAPEDIGQVVLQKRDGRTYLVLWNTGPVWDPIGREAIEVVDEPVSFAVPDGYAVSRVVRLADDGPAADQELPDPGPRAEVEVGPTLSVVELTPSS